MNNINYNNIFWNLIRESKTNCRKLNKIRKLYKQKYSKDTIDKIDSIYDDYFYEIWIKFEPIYGKKYNEESDEFHNLVFFLLSKGKNNLEKLLSHDSNYFRDVSKYIVEYKVEEKLFEQKSNFQLIQIFKSKDFGNILVIDGDVQLTQLDQMNYHEMISHVPINYFNKNLNVLIIGGGDGGTAKEVLKHNNVYNVTMVEIDKVVIDACKKYFPEFTSIYQDNRFNLIINDGAKYVKDYQGNLFDIVIIDSTDFNTALPLFTKDFYLDLKKIVNKKHIICFNADNINWNEKNIVKMVKFQRKLFNFVNPYSVSIPTFAGGFYSFCLVSDSINPLDMMIDWEFYKNKKLDLSYYNHKIHVGSFSLPNNISKKLKKYLPNIEKKIKGVHYLIDFEGIPFEILNDENKLSVIFEEVLKISEMTILDRRFHKFQPQGYTGFYLLSESHLSFHTWPEKGTCSIDIYSCGSYKLTKKGVQHILEIFKDYQYKLKKVAR